jgi:hypothetical protein
MFHCCVVAPRDPSRDPLRRVSSSHLLPWTSSFQQQQLEQVHQFDHTVVVPATGYEPSYTSAAVFDQFNNLLTTFPNAIFAWKIVIRDQTLGTNLPEAVAPCVQVTHSTLPITGQSTSVDLI